ncbi:MAG: HRDC domain-containing protein [Pseudomonadota bacterium]|nr:HRDC domain-containing protein [Desulfobacterales bacterium]
MSFTYIDTGSGLEKFTKSVEKSTAVAVDLEADSMYHFQEKVCLIQMATRTDGIVIDPIRIKDISLLKPLFSNSKIKKVFHGADYDVRSLYRDFGIQVNHLFDTQVACMFLGLKETGLDAVLHQRFNIRLDKKYQKKDWSKRPLTQEMMAYAVADVMSLIPLAEILEKELERKGRLYWVYEESEIISKVRPSCNEGHPLYLRFKGAGQIDRRGLGILEALLQFRVQVARQKDKPLFKIFPNNALLKVASEKPTAQASLTKANIFSPKQINMYGHTVIEIVNRILKTPANRLPVYPKKQSPRVDASVSKRIRALKAWRDSKARALDIDPGVFFSNHLIGAVAVCNPTDTKALKAIEEMKRWQRKEFGREIVSALRNLK